MTQHSKRTTSPLPWSALWGRLGGRFWPVALFALAAALLLAMAVLLNTGATAQAADKEITGLTLTSPNPGELVITWDAASPTPQDHRVMWAKSSEKFLSFKKENTDEAGNAYPTGTTHTVTGLPEGEEYKVRVRARYGEEKAGPFSDLVTTTISSTPEPTEDPTPEPTDEPTEEPTPQPASEPAAEPPAKPTGLHTGASHDSVLLSWTNPDDDSVTGYQVLRGPDADSLTVLADDTGSATTSYTDSSVAAETTYTYAVRARNAHGLSPESDPVSITTLAPPPAKPTGLLAVATHDMVTLSWTDPGDDSITGYQVLRGPDADSLTVLTDDTGQASPGYTDNSVAAETAYAYAVRARNAEGLSPQSGTVSITTLAPPPAKPTGMNHGSSHFSVLLIWTDPDDDSITGYQILRGADSASLTVLVDDTGSATTSYNDDSVDAETTYVYSVKARNANGLGPQSDPVTVTTLSAPPPSEEPRIARAVAGANFTLDGQALDTTDTCDDDDISNIAAACTIDIDTADVVFAVVGEVDSDDRLTVKTGRDKDNLTEHADQGDLRGTDQGVDLTFLPGRSLLRIWGDENESPGGGEEHYFRVNLVPYWELNGEQLSKSDDCKSTTDRTASEITDDDCIVTQFGNTANIQFSNVIKAQFNAYVYVNTTRVVDAPEDSDLANPFALDLADGDNVIRVRIASKGGVHGALSYGSNSFYYKVTTTDVLVSNLGQSTLAATAGLDGFTDSAAGIPFRTGDNSEGYNISAVRSSIALNSAAYMPTASIYSDNSGEPGSSVKVLDNPSSIAVSTTTTTEAVFDANDYHLSGDTPYWIVFEVSDERSVLFFDVTASDSEDSGAAPEWSIGNVSTFRSIGGIWRNFGASAVVKMAIKGELAEIDTTPPELVSATVASNGKSIDLIFNEVYDLPATVAAANTFVDTLVGSLTVTADGVSLPLSLRPLLAIVAQKQLVVRVTSGNIRQGQTVVITYTDPSGDDDEVALQDEAGNDMESFTTGSGGVPAVVNSSTVARSVPDAPTGLSATASGTNQIYLAWTAPLDNGGRPISGYKIEVSDDAGTTWADLVADTGTQLTSYAHSGLAAETTRHYRVSAINSLGASSASNVDSATTLSSTVTLSALAVEDEGGAAVVLTPTFVSTVTDYTATVANSVTRIKVTPTKADAAASIEYLDENNAAITDADATTTDVLDVDLDVGKNTIKVKVTNGNDSETYTLVVDRQTASLSTDATLSALVLKDAANNTIALNQTFASGTTSYTATVANSVSRITVEPTKGDVNAAIEYLDSSDSTLADADTTTPAFDLDLTVGANNVVKVKVTAQDTNFDRTYTITVTRQAAANQAATGRPTITGDAEVGQTLTADATGVDDPDGLTNRDFSYQWVRIDGQTEDNITGAVSQQYVLTNDELGLKVKVEVRFVDDRNELESVSSFEYPFSGTIRAKPNRQPTELPTILGQHEVGHTLTASTSDIGDLDGLTGVVWSYQWERLESGSYEDIADAESMLYTLTSDDEGKRVRVRVTFDDDDGNRHSLDSFPSGIVQAQSSVPSDKVEVSLGQTAYTVREGDSVDIEITLATAPEELVRIPYGFTRDGETSIYDYSTMYRGATAWSHLHFYTGQTVQRVTVIAENDDLNDDGESLTFYLGEMPAGYAVLVNRDRATINIEDTDDPNSVQVYFRNANYYVHEDGGPVTVRVVMDPVPDREITIPITFTRGGGKTTLPGERAYTFPGGGSLSAADHSMVTTSVTFGPEVHRYHNIPAYRDIEIWATDDSVDDDGEFMDITFGNVTDAFTTVRTGNNTCCSKLRGKVRPFNMTRVWFQDNDFTEVPVENRRNYNGNMYVTFSADTYSAPEGGGGATVSVWLLRGGDVEREVTIPITMERMGEASSSDTIHTSIPSSITFKPGQTAQTFRVAARDDSIDDDGEWLQLSFGTLPERVTPGVESTCDYGACAHDTARVNLVDNDHPAITVSFEQSSYQLTATEDPPGVTSDEAEIKVILSAAPERAINTPIHYRRVSGGGGIQIVRGARFEAGQTEAIITVRAYAPSKFEEGETHELSFGALPDRVSAGATATATITVNTNP